MTELEKDSYELFIRIRDAWTMAKISRVGFMELMGDIAKMIRSLEARAGGCPAGRHYTPCTCIAAVVGHTKYHQPGGSR